MDWLLDFLHLFAIGIPGWLALRLVRLPAAPMMGAMLSSALFAVQGWGLSEVPGGANLILQIVLGLFIGVRVTPEARSELAGSAPVAFLASAWWLSLPLGLGWMVTRWFGLDLSTSLLGTVPGGIAEMSLLALSLNADAALVAMMQFFRLAAVLVGMPVVSAWINRRIGEPKAGRPKPSASQPAMKTAASLRNGRALALVLAVLGGLGGSRAGLPAGAFVGAMAATGIAAVSGLRLTPLPVGFRTAAQVGLGSLIGLSATPEVIGTLQRMLLPTLAITAAMVAWGIVLAFVVRRITRWSLMTCLIATCPGGITQLASIAEELGADPLRVSLLHLVRLFTIFLVLPPLISRILA